MKRFALSSCALTIGAAVLLTACGGSQPPIGAPGAMPQSRAIGTHAQRGGSWMLPEAGGRNLLYGASGSVVYVYTYPGAKLVGTIAPFQDVFGECLDKSGDIFVVDYYYGVYEYAHGGTTPIASLYNQAGRSIGCSVDPTTGNLAISGGFPSGNIVTVFPYNRKRGWRYPKFYGDSAFGFANWCGYDEKGNLYVDGYPNSTGNFGFAELPKGADALTNITIDKTIQSPGGVLWDGRHMTVGDWGVSPTIIYRFIMKGSTASVIGATTLGGSKNVSQYWIVARRIIGSDYSANDFEVWKYSGGGMPIKTIGPEGAKAVVVSLAPSG
jgi:hypothetical protein